MDDCAHNMNTPHSNDLGADLWEGQPLYGHEAKDGGPQCSASSDFCFLCHFEHSPTDVGTPADLYGSLVDTINSLGEQKRELEHIIAVVHQQYEKYVRPHLSYVHPDTNIEIKNPAWVKASIRRHLLYSSQFRSLYHITIEQMYHSIFEKQNANMVDASTGQVSGEKLKEFNDTIKSYLAFQKHVNAQKILQHSHKKLHGAGSV